jgi:hypothetical protein
MENEITHLDVSKFRNEEAYGYFTLVEEEFQKIAPAKFQLQRDEFTGCLALYNDVLERTRKNAHTRKIADEDARRDAAYRAIVELTRTASRHFNPAIAEAAQGADEILGRYGNPTNMPYLQENGVLSNLIEDFDTVENRARLAIYGAEEWLDELIESNRIFISLYVARNEEEAAAFSSVPVGAVCDARLALGKSYHACVKRINALAEVEGPEAYTVVIANINQLIRKQKGVINARRARGKAGEREVETGNEDQ